MEIANAITEINASFRGKNKNILLVVPGRIGTSSPELGIPIKFSGISQFCGIIEMDYGEVGYAPELSYGSHMFQDLVEADIFYTALFQVTPDDVKRQKDVLENYADRINMPSAYENLNEIVFHYRLKEENCMLYYNIQNGKFLCGINHEITRR